MQLFLAFFVALSITAVTIPLLERWAGLAGLTDAPGPRKVHSAPVPRVGGIAMAVGMIAALALAGDIGSQLRGLSFGVAVLLVFGVWDDRVTLGYRAKFAGQILAVFLCLYFSDVRIASITLDARYPLPDWVSLTLTAAFLVGVTNAVNLSDGLDGLAGGMALLCSCAIALLALLGGNLEVAMMALVTAGAILGFLRFNTHPARIFMGDCGSQILGFTLGVLAILVSQGEQTAVSAALPVLLIGMPIFDTLAVMAKRISLGVSPFAADRNHLHHRLLALGFRHSEAVVAVYLMQGMLFLLAYFMRFESDITIIAVFLAFAAVTLALLGLAMARDWKLRRAGRSTAIARLADRVPARQLMQRIPGVAAMVMGFALAAYAVGVIAASAEISGDVAILCAGMLLVLIAASSIRSLSGSRVFDRGIAYTCAVLLVYLDQTVDASQDLIAGQSWILLGVTGVAAILRLAFTPGRRFQATTLDLLVLFIAVVVPQLPGPLQLPPQFTGGLAKAVVLLYVTEMMLAIDLRPLMPRALLAMTLAAIAVRGAAIHM